MASSGGCTSVSSPSWPTRVSQSPSFRSRTPPDLKWLLNERAAVAGAVAGAASRCEAMTTKLALLQRQTELLAKKLQHTQAVRTGRQSTLDSLDVAIGLAYSQVRPDAAGKVNAQAGKYGKRGGLRTFVISQLTQAGSTGANSRVLGISAIVQFQIDVFDEQETFRFLSNTLRPLLKKLKKQGLVETVPGPKGLRRSLAWRLKQAPTLAELAVQAAVIAKAAANELKPSPGRRPSPTDSNPS